jgi:hypothetical protein
MSLARCQIGTVTLPQLVVGVDPSPNTCLSSLVHQSLINHTTYPKSSQLSQYSTVHHRACSVCFEAHYNYHRPGFRPVRSSLLLARLQLATTGGERSNQRQQSAIYLGTDMHKCETLSRQAGIEQLSKHAQGKVLGNNRASSNNIFGRLAENLAQLRIQKQRDGQSNRST